MFATYVNKIHKYIHLIMYEIIIIKTTKNHSNYNNNRPMKYLLKLVKDS